MSGLSGTSEVAERDRYLDIVQHRMLSVAPERPSAAIIVEPHANWMLSYEDTSFARQIDDIDVGNVGPGVPDAYAVTLNSAVPVADSVRGYYEELGRDCPPIFGLHANSHHASYFYIFRRGLAHEHSMHVKELEARFRGAANICIIDQNIATGRTMSYGAHLLSLAGVELVTGIRGKWYEGIRPNDVDLTTLTSTDAYERAFMNNIGRLAAQHSTAQLQTN